MSDTVPEWVGEPDSSLPGLDASEVEEAECSTGSLGSGFDRHSSVCTAL